MPASPEDFRPGWLRFRRQYVIGPQPFAVTPDWHVEPLWDGRLLSVHPDLGWNVHRVGDRQLLVLGTVFDPETPDDTQAEIVARALEAADGPQALVAATYRWVGRWALLAKWPGVEIGLTDPCGLRQINFSLEPGAVWLGSSPEIVRRVNPSELDGASDKVSFYSANRFRELESPWLGAETIYSGCRHLAANHWLDTATARMVRFFPDRPVQSVPVPQAVERATVILQATLQAAAKRFALQLPVTGGWDSRVLLAASRPLAQTDRVRYFVDRMGVCPPDHADVRVPQALAKRLGFELTVENSLAPPPWFEEQLRENVTLSRTLPKTNAIYTKLTAGEARVNINGNVSEICRCFYQQRMGKLWGEATVTRMLRVMGFAGSQFAGRALEEWLDGLKPTLAGTGLDVLDMLYWEQRMGNWGAQYPAEQDISVDELSPFNGRDIIMTLLGTPAALRQGPDYPVYAQMAERMWPGIMLEPVNPSEGAVDHVGRVISEAWRKWLAY